MYVCVCAGVTVKDVDEALHEGTTLNTLRAKLGVACQCCCCTETLLNMLADKYNNGTDTSNNS